MAKKDNRQVKATDEMRHAAAWVAITRRYASEWKKESETAAKDLKGLCNEQVDITLVTENDLEVASITESDPSFGYDYEKFFDDNPALKANLHLNYRKEPTTRVTLNTKWVEPGVVGRVGTEKVFPEQPQAE